MISKGNFYHDGDQQIIADALLKNCELETIELGTTATGIAKIITSAEVPTVALLAPAGSICICTLASSIGLYVNTGTAEAPVWKAATLA